MGTDINGWVEFEMYDTWYGVIEISHFLHRNYDAFACLFGVNNSAGFKTIAANRGLPDDVSENVKNDEILSESHNHSWIALSEIEAIDWDEYATRPDQRVKQYHLNNNGEWVLKYKSRLPNPPPIDISREGRVKVDDILYEITRMQRREVLPYWSPLFDMMRIVATRYENVRLVVYFDS